MKRYSIFDIGCHKDYFDDDKNRQILHKVSEKCYLPTNKLIYDLIHETDGQFRVSYSLTGVVLDQFQEYLPEVLESFQSLVDTGCVELLGETYYHSLAALYSEKEFADQVNLHKKKLKELFGYKPRVFRNSELVYNNRIAYLAEKLDFDGIVAEGVDNILGWRSPNFVYKAKMANDMRLLLKNYRLSDDIAFRFSERGWSGWPLTAEKFASWVNAVNGGGNVVNLFMDYETFGEHQWADTGIFEFMRHLPREILKNPSNDFKTVSETIDSYPAVDEVDIRRVISWADVERDLSAWLGNDMQRSSIACLYDLEAKVRATQDPALMNEWRKMQTTDHFYYMCTKWFNDGDVHKYFNAYDRPHDSFIAFTNALNDFRIKLRDDNSDMIKAEV